VKKSGQKVFYIIIICLLLQLVPLYAYFDQDEPALAPLTLWTSDVLRQKEWFFCPWGWTAFGITDRITLEWDWMLAVGLCPAGYIKVNYYRDPKCALSFDLLDYYIRPQLVDTVEDFQPGYQFIGYKISGNLAWLHASATYSLTQKLRAHVTTGFSYTGYYKIWRKDPLPIITAEFTSRISPDLWCGLEYNAHKSVHLIAALLYGNSFGFWDQIPRKLQVIGGVSWAPFPDNWWGILRRWRLDVGIFNTYFLEIDREQGFLPAPYFYWQVPF